MPAKHAPVAQLDRALDYESRGQEFESLRARQIATIQNKTANPMVARHDGRHVGFNFEGRHSQRKSYGGKSPIALFVDELATALKGVGLLRNRSSAEQQQPAGQEKRQHPDQVDVEPGVTQDFEPDPLIDGDRNGRADSQHRQRVNPYT
jgi:hypothetical protein